MDNKEDWLAHRVVSLAHKEVSLGRTEDLLARRVVCLEHKRVPDGDVVWAG